MWIPANTAEIEAAVNAGQLEETASFDAKAAIPARNAETAKDIAAMATGGGVILYGVGEDENERLTLLQPFELAGAADRIGQIVATSIAEVPHIEIKTYPTTANPAIGYLLVVVPQSARAPHQVIVGGDHRYYGRGPKANRKLTEPEVARLYDQRRMSSVDRDALLDEAIEKAPVPKKDSMGYLHAFARPVVEDAEMYERFADKLGGYQGVYQRLLDSAAATKLQRAFSPSLTGGGDFTRISAEEWRLASLSEDADYTNPSTIGSLSAVTLRLDGQGRLFCGRATDTHVNDRHTRLLVDLVIAGNLEQFFAIMGLVYRTVGYLGSVDVGMAVTNIRGARSAIRSQDFRMNDFPYGDESFRRHTRVMAGELADPHVVAFKLLRHFYEATTGYTGANPFEDPKYSRG